jgi:hypothetical protein
MAKLRPSLEALMTAATSQRCDVTPEPAPVSVERLQIGAGYGDQNANQGGGPASTISLLGKQRVPAERITLINSGPVLVRSRSY